MTTLRRLFYGYARAQHARLVLDLTDSYAMQDDLLLTHF